MTVGAARVGILGGSFDPPHHAHLHLAQTALTQLKLDEVRFVVAGEPWQKTGVSSSQHRLAMTFLALGQQPGLSVDTTEIERAGPSYMVDTLHTLRQRYGAQACLVLILGGDQYANLGTWHHSERLLQLANIAVAQRGTHATFISESSMLAPTYPMQKVCGELITLQLPLLDISSTQIRQAVRGGHIGRIKDLLPSPVLAYILEHHLYQETL